MASPIINKNKFSQTKIRKDAMKIIESAYEAIDIQKTVSKRFVVDGDILKVSNASLEKHFHLDDYKNIFVIGFGKGSFAAVSKMSDILKNNLTSAVSLDVKDSFRPKKANNKVRAYWGTHPQPSIKNIKATKKIVSIAKDAGKDDLIIYFIGGGGSSLLCGSLNELKYAKTLFNNLTRKGATIDEINVVRKHISEVKGGNLAKFTYPAQSLSLIVSDVCGNPLEVIASGPTIYDKTNVEDAIIVLKKYDISIENIFFVETPKDKHYFDRCEYFLFACDEDAVMAMISRARALGYKASIGSLALVGEAKSALLPFVKKIKSNEVIICAGETTVKIIGKGKGGRNQEACLSIINQSQEGNFDISKILVSSFASDGFDNTPVAGAIADVMTLKKTISKKINSFDYLKNNDSYSFFQKTGDFLRVERKAFNVADLMLIIKE